MSVGVSVAMPHNTVSGYDMVFQIIISYQKEKDYGKVF